MNEFPKWLYHKVYPPALAENETEAEVLGEGWAESPAEFGVITAPSVRQAAEMKRRTMGLTLGATVGVGAVPPKGAPVADAPPVVPVGDPPAPPEKSTPSKK